VTACRAIYQRWMFVSRANSFDEIGSLNDTKKSMNHTRNVNVPAITASATPACAARADTVPSASAPPELLPDEDVPVPVEVAPAAESEPVPKAA